MSLLAEQGFDVKLVDPRQMKNVPGRKSDVLDCQWIQQLHTFGLLAGVFWPNDEICVLRSYFRQRAMQVSYASHHIQHIQKSPRADERETDQPADERVSRSIAPESPAFI